MRMVMMLAITVIHMIINLPVAVVNINLVNINLVNINLVIINSPVAVVERCCLGPTCNQLAALAI